MKEATEAKIARNKPGAPQGAPDEITGERRQRDSAERKPRFARVDRRLDEVERAPILRRADEALTNTKARAGAAQYQTL
ncbi:MAG TPA: hypothetical protein VN858_02025 [Casimicrobiaceae bacterium]|nr:hypothetical protein [Casimicrobiaceae bacterium]